MVLDLGKEMVRIGQPPFMYKSAHWFDVDREWTIEVKQLVINNEPLLSRPIKAYIDLSTPYLALPTDIYELASYRCSISNCEESSIVLDEFLSLTGFCFESQNAYCSNRVTKSDDKLIIGAGVLAQFTAVFDVGRSKLGLMEMNPHKESGEVSADSTQYEN
jgi:hypothetical protein